MHLTQYTDYALRLLVYLATHPDETPSVGKVSAAFGVSEHHMAAIAKRLVVEGVLAAKRGRGGGVRLAKAPEELRLGALVRMLERSMNLVECFDRETNTCPIAGACMLEHALHDARTAFFASLDAHTLADVVVNRPRLLRLLGKKTGAAPAR